ncbi:MAG: histidine kinase dimerization/phospho-acceptor domain-containing protein [Candidatus Contendobacter sp.]
MNCQQVCPFYGQSIDHCDVGAGYISPYHVEVIVRHCTSRYEDCARFQELSERRLHEDGEGLTQQPTASNHCAYMPSGGLLFPLQFDREVITVLNHEIRTPLTSIRSFTEILLGYPIDDPDARRRFLQIIHGETVRLTRAMDRLFGRAGSNTLAPASVKSGSENYRIPNPTTQVEMNTP